MESVERLSGRVSIMRDEIAMYDSARALESRRRMLEFKEAISQDEDPKRSLSDRQLPPPPPAESFAGSFGRRVKQPLAIRRAPPDHMNEVLMSEPVFLPRKKSQNYSDDLDSVNELPISTSNSPPRPVAFRSPSSTQLSQNGAQDLLAALRHNNAELLYTTLESVDNDRQWSDVQMQFRNIAPENYYGGDLVAAMQQELTYRQLNVCKNILLSNKIVLRDSSSKLVALSANVQKSGFLSRSVRQPIPNSFKPDGEHANHSSVNQRGRTRSGGRAERTSVSPQRESSLRGRSKRRDQSVSVGSLVTVTGLSNRADLNHSQGKVIDKHSGVLKVRFPNEEVLLKEQNVTPAPIQQLTQKEGADVLIDFLKSGNQQGIISYCEKIPNKSEWDTIAWQFENKAGSDIHISLRAGLDSEMYQKVVNLLEDNLGVVSPQYLSPEFRSSEKPVQRGRFCTSCGHELTTPYCGLTGKKHLTAPDVNFLSTETKAVLISSVDVPNSNLRLSKERGRDIESLRACLSMVGVTGRAVVHKDPDTKECRKALRWLSRKACSGDSLVLYFTGAVDKKTGGLLTSDGEINGSDFEGILTAPAGVTVTCIFDCCAKELLPLPYRLCKTRGGGIRVTLNDDTQSKQKPKADIVSISFSPSTPSYRSGVITSPLCQLLSTNSTPTLECLYQSLSDYFKANDSTRMLEPEISMSWNALPRQERLVLSDIIVS